MRVRARTVYNTRKKSFINWPDWRIDAAGYRVDCTLCWPFSQVKDHPSAFMLLRGSTIFHAENLPQSVLGVNVVMAHNDHVFIFSLFFTSLHCPQVGMIKSFVFCVCFFFLSILCDLLTDSLYRWVTLDACQETLQNYVLRWSCLIANMVLAQNCRRDLKSHALYAGMSY